MFCLKVLSNYLVVHDLSVADIISADMVISFRCQNRADVNRPITIPVYLTCMKA